MKLNVRWRRLLEKLYAVFVCVQQRALLHKSPKEYKQYTSKVLNLLKCNFSLLKRMLFFLNALNLNSTWIITLLSFSLSLSTLVKI